MASEKRLIDANALRKRTLEDIYSGEMFIYLEDLDDAPTVEAVPVVHGRWINETKEIHGMVDERNDCSNCGQVYWFACPDFNYCPNCGAKMDGDGHEN